MPEPIHSKLKGSLRALPPGLFLTGLGVRQLEGVSARGIVTPQLGVGMQEFSQAYVPLPFIGIKNILYGH
jgi:hypothetical protein